MAGFARKMLRGVFHEITKAQKYFQFQQSRFLIADGVVYTC